MREAIVNAIAHRDYSIRGEGIRLLMFADRFEVYSPGRLPGHVTIDNMKDERYSRNEAVVAVLSDLGYIERLGYGIDRMLAAMQEAGLRAPVFEEMSAGFRVTLYSASDELVVSQPEAQQWPYGYLNRARRLQWLFFTSTAASPTATIRPWRPTSAPRPFAAILRTWSKKTFCCALAKNGRPITSSNEAMMR